MRKEHHSLVMQATGEILATTWQKPPLQGTTEVIDDMYDFFDAAQQNLPYFVANADDITDLQVDAGLSKFVIGALSGPTSFQHFAYGNYFEQYNIVNAMRGVSREIKLYEGYCWDTDPFLPWYLELANLAWANIRYTPVCNVFNETIMRTSPGARLITGKEDWDDQVFPSAIDLAEYYGQAAWIFRHTLTWSDANKLWTIPCDPTLLQEWEERAFAYCCHMLQDLCVPHHVLGTIGNEHREYEQGLLNYWRRLYAGRSKQNRQEILDAQINASVKMFFDLSYQGIRTFRDLGKTTVYLTTQRLYTKPALFHESRIAGFITTTQAIAVTLKALEIHMKGEQKEDDTPDASA